MITETLLEYVLNDPVGTLVQIPAYVFLIGMPIWIARRIYLKRKNKQQKEVLDGFI